MCLAMTATAKSTFAPHRCETAKMIAAHCLAGATFPDRFNAGHFAALALFDLVHRPHIPTRGFAALLPAAAAISPPMTIVLIAMRRMSGSARLYATTPAPAPMKYAPITAP